MSRILEIVNGITEDVPGVVGVLLIDADGLPVAAAGDFDLDPYDLGAIVAACHQSYHVLGQDLGQFWVDSIIAEFDDLKLVQSRMPRGILAVVAEKSAPLGVIRMEAKRSIQEITSLMEASALERERLLETHQLRKPKNGEGSQYDSTDLISYLQSRG
jgi:predicted regulator of Ras-like GTPase activity (Roadblock/LC7/MglB family)